MLNVSGKARLVTDPKQGRTGAGKPWANAVLRVVNYKKTDAGWEEHSSFSCTAVAFEDVAFKLAAFAKGDEVEFTGRVRELKVWTPNRGEPRAQLGISLDDVTAPVKRPRGNRGDIATDDPWPRPAVPGQGGPHRRNDGASGADQRGAQPHAGQTRTGLKAGAAQRGPGAVITNLRDHVARRSAS